MPIPFYHPKPAPEAAFQGEVLPIYSANILSKTVFQWIAPIMQVGYSRPIQAEDLWTLPPDLQCQNIADILEANFNLRLPPSRRLAKFRPVDVPVKRTILPDRTYDIELDSRKLAEEEEAIAEAAVDLAPGIGESLPAIEQIPEIVTSPSESSSITRRDRDDRQEKPSTKPTASEVVIDPELAKSYGKKKAAKLAAGKIALEEGKIYDMSLVNAIWHTVKLDWFVGCTFYGVGSALRITAPLVTQIIIRQMETANAYHKAEKAGSTAGLTPPKSVGYGIGLAVALFVMEMAGSICVYQSQQKGSVIGFSTRAALIDLISRKSMRFSNKSRIQFPNGRLVTMVSADASFLDFAAPMTVNLCIQPLQILVGIGLLIYTLGYSALVGLAVLVMSTPIQGQMFIRLIGYRQAQMQIVDKRVRLLTEIVNNIRAVKLYAYETLFGEKVSKYRREELSKLRKNGINRATMTATMSFIPILAAVLTFVTYGLSGHTLNASSVFAGLQYFNVLRQPIAFLPIAFTAVSDAAVAIGRIGEALRADELPKEITVNPSASHAIEAKGSFQFDSVIPPSSVAGGGMFGGRNRTRASVDKKNAKKAKKAAAERKKKGLPEIIEKPKMEEGVPFSLRDIALKIPRGSLVCIVGRVGTGKTSLLSGLISEMRQVEGNVVFGGPVSYVPQHAWVQSGTIRDNITFSTADDVDLDRVSEVIQACALQPDIDMWADGEFTRIGERGITLSGGQRQRICLARAAYDVHSEVVLLDDPLSAVDAHVGHHLLQKCILDGPLAKKTRVLVTHHLDVLPLADLVIVMDRNDDNEGRIIQQGRYDDLRDQSGVFRTLMEEFGSTGTQTEAAEEEKEPEKKEKPTEGGGKLLIDEEREVGAVSLRVYAKYGKAMGGWRWVGLCAIFLCVTQGSNVANSLFLGFWSGNSIKGFKQGEYMAVYACLGLSVAIFTWLAAYTMILAGIRASFLMFNGAWSAVMRSPVGWHDRTPTGRIINRLSKDIEMLDDRLSQVWNQLLTNALSVVGSFALVIYSFPWLGLMYIPLCFLYYCAASYYRMSSREVKRVDSILRSAIYGSFGEQLAGLAVIRAFGQQRHFIKNMQNAINNECQAYIVTITIQRWLGMRLDLMSFLLVLLIAMFGAIFRDTVSPSKLGVVLTYSLQAASVFSQLVSLFAQMEQEMNNVERVQYYNDLEVEADPKLPTDPKPEEWPLKGLVEFEDVQLRYRENLPLVLRNLSFTINAGEKVGIIGRTGAGKSSIAQALFRSVELAGGKIKVDGLDLRQIGLETVRSRLGIIPQDAFLYAGTVRENIDPDNFHSDEHLDRFVQLIHINSGGSKSFRDKFQLDAVVLNEGSNFSAGERQLLALIRALVRNCQVLLLDEATSSVDPETDAVIQRIIQTELSRVTLISIAHRLQTVAYYDRILVMDSGSIAEFDTPLALFDTPGSIFRGLCDTKNLSREDILKIRNDAAAASSSVQV